MPSPRSPQQDHALKQVAIWLQHRTKPVFRLFGYAGTGKTTLAKQIAADARGKVIFAAFTGKAAQVLEAKGCTGARTIHSLIYRPDIGINGEPRFKLNHESELLTASLLIIDECSMVGEDLAQDLLSFGVPILVLGDPGQLPPINGTGYFTDGEPDVLLTEVHRQAADNPIIYLAQRVREGHRLEPGHYGESRVVRRALVEDSMVMDADQVLVGRNTTRKQYNAAMRRELGFTSWLPGFSETYPAVGERLVCLRNNSEKALLNGGLWRVDAVRNVAPDMEGSLQLRVRANDFGNRVCTVNILPQCFNGTDIDTVPWRSRREYDEFAFAYAMTVHKAQGSQWGTVFLEDESAVFRDNRDRWLYTGITRAADRVTVVAP